MVHISFRWNILGIGFMAILFWVSVPSSFAIDFNGRSGALSGACAPAVTCVTAGQDYYAISCKSQINAVADCAVQVGPLSSRQSYGFNCTQGCYKSTAAECPNGLMIGGVCKPIFQVVLDGTLIKVWDKVAQQLVHLIHVPDAGCAANQVVKWNGIAWVCTAVGTTEIANGAITGSKIAAGAVSRDKIAACSAAGQILKWNGTSWACGPEAIPPSLSPGDGITISSSTINATLGTSISTGELDANAVNTSKIQDGAVTTIKIADSTVSTNDLQDAGVTMAKIADGAVAAAKIGNAAVTPAKIAACATGQILKYGATGWACAVDAGSAYTGVSPISVTGTTVSLNTTGCTTGQILKYNGSTWACAADAGGTGGSSASPSVFVGVTSSSYNGSRGGYAAANNLCSGGSGVLSGSHICSPEEIIRSYSVTPAISFPSSGDFWINNGPPAYIENISNDCNGWQKDTTTIFGSLWAFGTGLNYSAIKPCSQSLPFACCR